MTSASSGLSPFHSYVWKGNSDLALTRWPINARIKQMSLGFHHSAFLTYNGHVLSCGHNTHGQLGIGTEDSSYMDPVLVSGLDDEEVTSVAVGLHHTVFGTKSGKVYCCGDSSHAQCGSTQQPLYNTPVCVASFNSPVKKVDCCSNASVCLLENGALYGWGTGDILKDTLVVKQQVLEPSKFRFIEDRTVLDVSCGTNFIVAVIKKSATSTKKLKTKNNYVIVHKSDSELEAYNSMEAEPQGGSSPLKGGAHCPLGLEVTEEHVFLPSSENNSPASQKKYPTRSPLSKSRQGSISYSHQIPISSSSSGDSLNMSGLNIEMTEQDRVHEHRDSDDLIQIRSRSATVVSHHAIINVNQNEAEKWLQQRIGPQFSIKESEVPPVSTQRVDGSVTSDPAARGSYRDSRLPQYVESMWNSITSSSHAVTSAVQTHIVSKIPMLDKLTSSHDETISSPDAFGLTPILPSIASNSSIELSTSDVDSTREDSSLDTHSKSAVDKAMERTRSFNSMSSFNQKHKNRSLPHGRGDRMTTPPAQQEFVSSACIDTEVWTWGCGDHGQLGQGDCLDRCQPSVINNLSDSQVYRVECSSHTAFVISTDGKVHAWGDNSNSQIMHGDKTMILRPVVLLLSRKLAVSDLACGADHTLLKAVSSSNNSKVKSGLFITGEGVTSELGQRVEFTRRLGYNLCMACGPNNISSLCVQANTPIVYQDLLELQSTEIQLYRMLLEIVTEVLEPMIESDPMTSLLNSAFGECLKNTLENLFRLVNKIGLNTQELTKNVTEPLDLMKTSLMGNYTVYLKAFRTYATHFHNLLAMNGVVQLVNSVKTVLLNREQLIISLVERCMLEYSDELLVNVCTLLQLPLRRINEYHEALEKIQLQLEDGSAFTSCLNHIESTKQELTDQFSIAESTRIFWMKCPKAVSASLKEPTRRLIRESKSLSLSLIGGSKLYKNWFVLFNDVFVHIQGGVHKVYPLEKLWIETGPGTRQTDEVGEYKQTGPEHEIKMIMPEASLNVQASNTAEKAEWMWILSQTVTLWLSSFKSDSRQSPVSNNRRSVVHRTTPVNRVASHMFYKAGPLQGAVYKGQWKRALMHGDGQITWADGRVYVGQFCDGEQTGYGKLTYKVEGKVETIEGYWNKGKLHGFAKAKYASGDSYTGFYRDNQYSGHGVLKQKSTSSVYVGEWKEGKRHGYGVSDSQGEKYLGQWVKDVKQGPGLHITLDGYYMEGSFVNNKIMGQGLIMTSTDTYYEGVFTGLNEVQGKGVMVLNNGDRITGTFDGTWADGIKISSGVYTRQSPDHSVTDRLTPDTFGQLSTQPDTKWVELFSHAKAALGCQGGLSSSNDCEKAWEKVAVVFANLRSKQLKTKKRLYTEHLEKIPPHNLSALPLEHYLQIRRYLTRASDCELHPLGLLLKNLVDVFRTSYSGTGTHPRLLLHAREELLSLTHRYYDVIRILFPELPYEYSARRVISQSVDSMTHDTYSGDNDTQHTDGDHPNGDHPNDVSPGDIQLEVQAALITEAPEEVASEIITPTLLIYPMLLPKIYEPLFHLYALQNEGTDELYWNKIQRFNKQSDLTLLSYLGIDEKFWFISEEETPDEKASPSKIKPLEIRDECYIEAIETLQRLSTCMTPAEKLDTVQLTFDKINEVVKANLSDDFVWSMDDLFPVFLFVVIRSRLRYLGSELQFMEELMDSHLEYGELGLMFTTLKACHLQIQTEKLM